MRKKREKRHQALFAILLVIAMLTGMVPAELASVKAKEAKTPALTKENKVSDPSTMNGWKKWQENGGKVTTNNVGRVWTDKSVYTDSVTANGKKVEIGQSDFLVSLSALSSTANLTTVTSMPLDIVLVLDASGSMDETLGNQVTYQEAYKLRTSKRYYIKEQGSYRAVQFYPWQRYWYRVDNWERVEPKESAQDSNPSHVQFYIRKDVSKMDALHTAVNNFLDATAAENQKIDDVKKQHRVSVVKFASDVKNEIGNDINRSGYNYSQIVTNLAAITEKNKESIKGIVNSIQPGGATRADNGMQMASNALNYEYKTTSQKVVIFFTDGEPTSTNQFEPAVAKDAIEVSYNLKNNSTDPVIVYGIGMLDGANPDDIDHSVNGFLNGISSNYPKARNYVKTKLGTRVEAEKQYYYAANDADKLNQIFQNIFEEISQVSAGAPTEVKGGNHRNSGYITFHEVVGDYMHVDGFQSIVVGDTCFEKVHKIENSDKDTYVFEGTWKNANGNNANVEDIIIQVSHVQDVRSGDEITVKIPASCIPQSVYDIDKEENLTVNYAQPLSVFYTVSLKPEVEGLLKNPDPAMKEYIESHKNKEGSVEFYSSLFSKNNENGFTTATFTPASQNAFYRFTENTPMYADPDCHERIQNSLFDPNNYSYWYLRSCFEQDAFGKASEKESKIEVKSVPDDSSVLTTERRRYVGLDSERYVFVKAGAPRLQRNDQDMFAVKTENKTGTVKTSNDPKWDQNEKIAVYLGNNGRMSVQIPGTLEVKKVATIAEGSTGPVDQKGTSTLNDQVFSFEIAASALANKTYAAEVKAVDGKVVSGSDMKLQFDANGLSSFTLKNNQTLLLEGLPTGITYEVKETTMPAGFSELKEKTQNAKGTIESGKVVAAEFHNEYKAKETMLSAENQLYVKKNFLNSEGKDAWNSVEKGTKFKARLSAAEYPSGVNEEKLFPQGAVIEHDEATPYITKELTSKEQVSFGEMTFDHVGKYVYIISEEIPAEPILGVTYSGEKYRVEIEVVDDGAGQLRVASNKMSALDANGEAVPLEHAVATITNEYNLSEGSATLEAKKVYDDATGTHPLKENMFTFAIRPLTEGAPVPQYQENQGWKAFEALDTQKSDAYKATNYANGDILFGTIRFDESKIVGGQPTTYVYECWEINEAKKGVTYDESHYYAHVTVSSAKDENGTACVKVETTWKTGPNKTDADVTLAEGETGPQFKNSYRAEKVTTQGENLPCITKEVKGLDAKEHFEFQMTAADEKTKEAIDAGDVTGFANKAEEYCVTKATEGALLKNKEKQKVEFAPLTFKKPGTYTFCFEEKSNAPNVNWEYDSHKYVVTYDVKDENGALTIQKSEEGSSIFTNTFAASISLNEEGRFILNVTKVLKGRDLEKDMFRFTIAGQDAVSKEKLTNSSDQSFKNTEPGKDGKAVMPKLGDLKFTQEDVGKTFTYTISEVLPKARKAAAYTYDTNPVTVAIKVVEEDNVLHTETTVTKNGKSQTYESIKGTVENPVVAEAPFVNSYVAGTVEINPATTAGLVKKVLEGNRKEALQADEFTFEMKVEAVGESKLDTVTFPEGAKDGIVFAKNKADGSIDFGKLGFDEAGQYQVTIREVKPEKADPNMSYDDHTFCYELQVVNNPKTGALEVSVVDGTTKGASTFTNIYTKEKEKGSLTLSKEVKVKEEQGISVNPEQKFTFQVEFKDQDGKELQDAYSIQDGKTIKSGEALQLKHLQSVTITGLPEGASYVVTETEIPAGYQAKETVLKGTIVGGKEAKAHFINTYGVGEVVLSGEAGIKVQKKLVGRDWRDSDAFTFDISLVGGDENGIKLPESLKVTDGAIAEFGDITCKKPGVYEVLVTENRENPIAGITYATGSAKVTLTVTDKGDGSMGVQSELQSAITAFALTNGGIEVKDGVIVFTNEYTPEKVVASIEGKKLMSGRELQPEDLFTFEIFAKEDAPLPALTKVQNDATGKFAFPAIAYEKEGTYVYTVKETGGTRPGVVNSREEIPVTVVVSYDQKKGVLKANVNYPEQGLTFTNNYQASSVVPAEFAQGIQGKKLVTASAGNAYTMQGGEFTFKLIPDIHNPKSDPIKETVVKNQADGSIVFVNGSVEYKEAGTYLYTLKEVDQSIPGITNDGAPIVIKVVVTDNQETGKLEASVSYTKANKDVAEIVFENKYDPASVGVVIAGTKKLTGKALEEQAFQFVLEAEQGEGEDVFEVPMPNADTSVRNDAAGNFAFGEIQYQKPGTYVYKVYEVNEQKEGYTYDSTTHMVKVVVTDADGKLQAAVSTDGAEGAKPVFQNSYQAAPVVLEGAKALKAKKVLEGRELQAGEFEFELKDKENQIVATGKNDADGTITFGSLKFEKEGTYYYVMSEKQNGIGGITYDESEVAVEIHVKDANGHLEAEVRYLDDGEETKLPVFTNTYQAEAVRVVLGASKELIGRELKASEFTFLLKDEDGKVVAKGYNDLYGVILFENLVFDQAGTYVYTICEEKGHEKDIVYDEAVYSYTIIVEDTKEGSFKVTVNTDGKPIVFTNQYKKPASPKPEKPETPKPEKPESPKPETQKPKPQKPAKPSAPKTGDEAPIVGMVVVMILAAAAIVGVIVYNIRRRKRK